MTKLLLAGIAAMAMLCASGGSAFAADGHWKFDLVNHSNAKVTSFKTQENGDWSDSWLDQTIAAGDEYEMDFGHADGDCTVRTRIDFSDGTYVDANIDYCNASTITVTNNGISWK